MEEDFDIIILGTGLTECILASILSCHGKKVLHLDENDYYGEECSSLSADQAWKRFKGVEKAPANLGRSREWNIDLVPKFPMSNGNIMKAIVHTGTTRYLEFKKCKGAYVLKKGKIHKVPSNGQEALTTGLMGFFQKTKLQKFLTFIGKLDENDPKTFEGIDPRRASMTEVYKKFGLDPESCDFIGHAMALYLNDDYLNQPALPTLKRIRLYGESVTAYGDSPYIYPKYGIGELCQAFARLSAVFGATYRLGVKVDEFIYDEKGDVKGLKALGEVPRSTKILAEPQYVPTLVKKTGQISRAICILSHPVQGADNADSGMIILPQKQIGRKSDIYLSFLSSLHQVCPKGKYLAFISTTVETNAPQRELDPAFDMLKPIDEIFFRVSDVYAPIQSGKSGIHISNSIDATSHFETIMDDVYRLYKELTGEDLDLTKEAEAQERTRRAAGCVVSSQDLEPEKQKPKAPQPPPPTEDKDKEEKKIDKIIRKQVEKK
ncbi:MAG: putative Rab GDP dissociation inhibitor alpha, partial [Streblomastix strix]